MIAPTFWEDAMDDTRTCIACGGNYPADEPGSIVDDEGDHVCQECAEDEAEPA